MSVTLCDHSSARLAPQPTLAQSGLALLRRIALWPSRVAAARRTMRQLSGMSDYELRDIGLGRYDIVSAASGRLDEDPMERLAAELLERRKAPRCNFK